MLDEHRDVLERVARERGYRSPAELMLAQCTPLFVAAGVPISA